MIDSFFKCLFLFIIFGSALQLKEGFVSFDLILTLVLFLLFLIGHISSFFLFESFTKIIQLEEDKSKNYEKHKSSFVYVTNVFEKHYKDQYRYGIVCASSFLFFSLLLTQHFVFAGFFLFIIFIENKLYYFVRNSAFDYLENLDDLLLEIDNKGE